MPHTEYDSILGKLREEDQGMIGPTGPAGSPGGATGPKGFTGATGRGFVEGLKCTSVRGDVYAEAGNT